MEMDRNVSVVVWHVLLSVSCLSVNAFITVHVEFFFNLEMPEVISLKQMFGGVVHRFSKQSCYCR